MLSLPKDLLMLLHFSGLFNLLWNHFQILENSFQHLSRCFFSRFFFVDNLCYISFLFHLLTRFSRLPSKECVTTINVLYLNLFWIIYILYRYILLMIWCNISVLQNKFAKVNLNRNSRIILFRVSLSTRKILMLCLWSL